MTAHAARERQGGAKSRITVHKHDVKRRMAERGLAFDGAARGTAASPVRSELPREASTVGPKKAREISLDDVQAALDAADGNITHAAQTLGIARNTFLAKMRAFGLRD